MDAGIEPLGSSKTQTSSSKPAKVIGTSKEEQKLLAAEFRKQAKREKKKLKSDAKKQRKENGILQHRMTRNNEKYVKNKDRNKERDIEAERNKIRTAAVRQAEVLASKHDMSGKLFNVGEVTIHEGKVESVAGLRRSEEVKKERALEKQQAEEHKKSAEEMKKARKEARKEAKKNLESAGNSGINPERLALVQFPAVESVTEKERATQFKKRSEIVLQKPIIPEGYSLPEGEENFVALWDLTDEEIIKRLHQAKSRAANDRKALRIKQAEQKKFNKAMKALKKEAARKGVLFDVEAAKKKVLDETEQEEPQKDSSSGSDSDSESDSGSGSSSESSILNGVSTVGEEKPGDVDSKKRKRSSDDVDAESTPKKSKSQDAAAVLKDKDKARKAKLREALDPEFLAATMKKEKKKVAAEKRRLEELASKPPEELSSGKAKKISKRAKEQAKKLRNMIEASKDSQTEPKVVVAADSQEPIKKRKKKVEVEEHEPPTIVEEEETPKAKKRKHKTDDAENPDAVSEKREKKKHKKQREAETEAPAIQRPIVGENWNTDALTGDEARKQKFLRLLGAGKPAAEAVKVHKSYKKETNITKVEAELEQQYEASVKKKHDGGSKRRGLGA